MFTGLVETVGEILHVSDSPAGRELRIRCSFKDLVDGESIALNGACLTVREHGVDDGRAWFTVAAVTTTLERTLIGRWTAGGRVHLERAMRVSDRLGGHFVLGHVDHFGLVTDVHTYGDAQLITIALPPSIRTLTVLHGSIAVNGVSLTVNQLTDTGIQLSIVEYTMRHTTLGELAVGSAVHVEVDVLAKHVQRLLAAQLGQDASEPPT